VTERETVPDEELVFRVQRGDRASFDLLVKRYKNPLTGFLYGVVQDYDRAQELSQDAFLRVYVNIRRYEPSARFSTWLYRIGLNLAIDETRRRKRWKWVPMFSTNQDGETFEREQPSTDPGPERRTLENETQQVVRAAIATLPDIYRTSLILKDLQGLSYEEIAAIQEIPEGTVKSRLNRARALLKERLTPYIQGRPFPVDIPSPEDGEEAGAPGQA